MGFRITKEFHFSASHRLDHLPVGHQCHRLHGHNYKVVLELYSKELNKDYFVKDYGELSDFKKWIDTTLDHRHLNDVVPIVTSAENLAYWIYRMWKPSIKELFAVSVSETPKTWARYENA